MAIVEHYYTRFEENKFYHIYNRTIDRKAMFCNDGNFEFFLKRYNDYLSPFIETFSYCLLGNHFHLLIKIRSLEELNKDLTTFQKLSNLNEKPKSVHDIISHQFRKFFQSYAMAFNKQQNRIGTLFQTPFKRALVDNDTYFMVLVYYIHANPEAHHLIDDFRDWKWSSYNRMLINKPSKLMKQEVFEWFGTKANFEQYHSEKHILLQGEKAFLGEDI